MDRQYDAREVLEGLVGKTIHTLTGRPNTVLGIEGDQVRVGTTRSPNGTQVPIQWVQDALDRLASEGEVEISVDSVGYRSAFIGAVLCTLEDAEARRPQCASSGATVSPTRPSWRRPYEARHEGLTLVAAEARVHAYDVAVLDRVNLSRSRPEGRGLSTSGSKDEILGYVPRVGVGAGWDGTARRESNRGLVSGLVVRRPHAENRRTSHGATKEGASDGRCHRMTIQEVVKQVSSTSTPTSRIPRGGQGRRPGAQMMEPRSRSSHPAQPRPAPARGPCERIYGSPRPRRWADARRGAQLDTPKLRQGSDLPMHILEPRRAPPEQRAVGRRVQAMSAACRPATVDKLSSAWPRNQQQRCRGLRSAG